MQHRLHLAGEDVHAADDEHVVGAARDAVHAGVGAAADAGIGAQPGDVAGAVTDEREGFLGERGDDQLAQLAFGQHLAGLGVDDLGQEVVVVQVEPRLRLDALAGHSRAR